MNTWFTRLTAGAFAVAALGLSSCKKDESKVTLQTNTAPTLSTTSTSPNLVATAANVNRKALTFTFTKADFGFPAAVNYEYQFDKKGGNFSSPVSISAGTTAKTDTLTTTQLIQAFSDLDLPYATAAQVDMRVVASVGTTAPTQVSPVVTLTGTPTPICVAATAGTWSLIGPAGDGWSTDRNMTYDCYSQTYRLRTTLNAGEFKFRQNNAWAVSLGGTSNDFTKGVTLTSSNGPNLTTTGGTYTIILTVKPDLSGGSVRFKP